MDIPPKIQEYFNRETNGTRNEDRYHKLLCMQIESNFAPLFLGPKESGGTYGERGLSIDEHSELQSMANHIRGICDALDISPDWFEPWYTSKLEAVQQKK